ncbi:MAG: ankyrin repeat domain-containing protein [Tannerella sp.]|jgi:ankyrin repeat protein|nr:ankyrin repeat domain-containing protein [Tannerella sp.]
MNDNINELLKIGLDAQDSNGKTPLILAAWEGDLKTVKKLLALGADISVTDNLGNNVLHYAARQENLEVLNVILDTNVDVNLKSEGGYKQTALFAPAEVGRIPILRTLLERGANPDIQDRYKMTALQWAIQQGKVEAVKTLLAFKANVNTKNDKGVTPLMSAATKGILECVQMLVEAGAEINATAKDGFTALMFCTYYGNTEVVKYLLKQGADKSVVGKKGETALSIAEKKKFDKVLAILS